MGSGLPGFRCNFDNQVIIYWILPGCGTMLMVAAIGRAVLRSLSLSPVSYIPRQTKRSFGTVRPTEQTSSIRALLAVFLCCTSPHQAVRVYRSTRRWNRDASHPPAAAGRWLTQPVRSDSAHGVGVAAASRPHPPTPSPPPLAAATRSAARPARQGFLGHSAVTSLSRAGGRGDCWGVFVRRSGDTDVVSR